MAKPTIPDRKDYLKKCVLDYKALNKLAPTYLLSNFTHAHEVHHYNTRNRKTLRLPYSKEASSIIAPKSTTASLNRSEMQKLLTNSRELPSTTSKPPNEHAIMNSVFLKICTFSLISGISLKCNFVLFYFYIGLF